MKIHIVQKGDTLWKIAKTYNVEFTELKKANVHIASPDMIMPGMKIKIPTDDKHVKHETKQKKDIKKSMELPVKKTEDKQINKLTTEKSISLGEQTLPSPKQLPKLTMDEQKIHSYPKQYHEKNKMYSQPKSNIPKPMQKDIKQTHNIPYNPQMMPMYGPPMNMCPVCGQVNEYLMPYYYPINVHPMPMTGQNLYGGTYPQQYYGTQINMNQQHEK